MGSRLSISNTNNQISQISVANKRKCRPTTGNFIFDKMNRQKDNVDFHGDHETHVSDGAEGELHTSNVVCEKNPGHTKFIPVDTFTLEDLPKGQRETNLYKLVKAAADLTVRVNVKMTSPHRPEFWPNANDPYPFYNGQPEVLRTGSGMMHRVYKYTDGVNQHGDHHRKNYTKCWCRKCEHSNSPSNVWWEFNVHTATHVVFDDIEASHTALRLFYDSKDSPLVIVNKVSIYYVNIKDDRCWLNCVTCDENVADKVEEMWEHYTDTRMKVCDKFKQSRDVSKLTFIVSHPHGCTKQVSIGHWLRKYKVAKDERKFTYTTCTCPGSSGAKVHCVGYRKWWRGWSYKQLVHSGTDFKHKFNYSGVSW